MSELVDPDKLRLDIMKDAELKRDFRMKMAECYDKILELSKRYLDMQEEQYHVITTWIIGTYFHESFPAYPFLFFNAMKGSGKTRALKFISALGNKGDGSVQNNLTEAVIFRIPRNTTTCIDEIEQIGSKDKQTLRELLNDAYKKGMKVKRMRKVKLQGGSEQQVVECFEPYYPIAMANIWGMDEVLGDRSITLILEKSSCERVTLLFEDFDNPEFQELKRTLEKFSVVSVNDVAKKTYKEWNNWVLSMYTSSYNTYNTYTTLTTLNPTEKLQQLELEEVFLKIKNLGISGRNFELLMPLLLVNNMLSEEHFDRFLSIGKNLMETKKEDEYASSKDVTLYDFVANWADDSDFKPIKALVQEFRLFCGDGEQDDRWLNDRWLGKALTRLSLIVKKRRIASGVEVIVNKKKAQEKLRIFKEVEVKK